VLRIIKKLLDTGVSLRQVRKAMETLRDMKQPATGTTLVSDGTRIYAVDSPEGVIDLLSKGQGVFALAIDKVWTDLEGTLAKGRRKGRGVAQAGGA